MHSYLSAIFGRPERALAAAIILTSIVFWLSSPYFLTIPNCVNLIEAYSVTAILAAAVFIVLLSTHYLMSRTRLGRQIYAFGGNPEAASRLGMNILGIQLFAYGYLGFLAAIGGFIQAYRVHQAVPTAMAGQELNVLAVAILGGASLGGGIGTMGGGGLGILLPPILINVLNLLGSPAYFF